jgi:hypothetical protein
MAQFGVKMNFLCILQVSAIKYIPKIYFLNDFPCFIAYLDWAPLSEELRGPGANETVTHNTAEVDGGFIS